MSRITAVEKVEPYCPKCLSALPTPDYWCKIEPPEKLRAHTIHCTNCNTVSMVRFFTGMDY